VESLPVPEAALREAVLNAILHKDYSSGTPVQISVYADRLMLWNPGELPQDWTVARLKAKHPSRPFNPGLANVFFRAGQIETWGRGIERIFSACTTAGIPAPALRCEQNGLWVDFEFGSAADIPTREAGEKTGEKAREKTRDKILGLIRADAGISMEAMALSLGLTRKGVEWQVRKLKQSGLLRRVGADKGGHWEILG
jgi:ATP-dependent DNA helicase RecG